MFALVMSQIKEIDREILTLFYLQDLSLKEIVAALDIPMGTVKRRLHVARRRFRKKVADLEKSEFNLQRESTKETIHKQIWIYGELHGNVSIDIGGIGFINDHLHKNIKLYRLKQEILVE